MLPFFSRFFLQYTGVLCFCSSTWHYLNEEHTFFVLIREQGTYLELLYILFDLDWYIYWANFIMQTKGRAHDDEAIEKMLNDLSLIKKFE